MEHQLPATSARRRSDRVSIAFPIEVAGIDATGHHFSDKSKTMTVSRYGCALSVQHVLETDQRIHLRRIGTNETAVGRVVASLGTQPEGNVYGIGTGESCEGLWGMRFNTLFYEELAERLEEGVYFVSRDRRITFWNDGAARLTGYAGDEVIGHCCGENLLGHVDETGRSLCKGGCPLARVLADGKERTAEFFLHHKDGQRVPVNVRVLPMRDAEGKVAGAVEVFSKSDARGEKRVTELEHLAFRDALTGLANRRCLEMKVAQAIEEHRQFGRLYGLLMFDLDRFKQVNDHYGHETGDSLLKAVGATLSEGRRWGDFVGRWGGEEFVVLMPDLSAVELGDLAERCRVLIGKSWVRVEQKQVSVTASIGATVLNTQDSPDLALRRVDELMYESKRAGGDQTTAG